MNERSDTQPEHDFPAGLSRPAIEALTHAGYTRLDQLTSVSEAEIGELHGMGPKGLRILRAALAERDLSFSGGSA
jgi:hypothetical protein